MTRQSWLDDNEQTSLIDDYAKQLGPFLDAVADGQIDSAEVEEQERRLVEAMKNVESKLDDETHADVTKLLCELTAHNIMQLLHEFQQSRPKTQLNL